jgi:hypothetical protein
MLGFICTDIFPPKIINTWVQSTKYFREVFLTYLKCAECVRVMESDFSISYNSGKLILLLYGSILESRRENLMASFMQFLPGALKWQLLSVCRRIHCIPQHILVQNHNIKFNLSPANRIDHDTSGQRKVKQTRFLHYKFMLRNFGKNLKYRPQRQKQY